MDGRHGRATGLHECRVDRQVHRRLAVLLVAIESGHGEVRNARQLNALIGRRRLHGVAAVAALRSEHGCLLELLLLLHLVLLHRRWLARHVLHLLHGLDELPLLSVVHLRLSGKKRLLKHLRLLVLLLVAGDLHGRDLEVGFAGEYIGSSKVELLSGGVATVVAVARKRRKLNRRAIVVGRATRDGGTVRHH